ncbi:MAG: 3-hydroxyacyl-CoA dehydrogenase/enoyl-CoA hydratase family protein [Bacteroidetes bacterium]|nr:MAG: 3-hydroxyacyl-CoA dehydrogenase/enoyl-CoA hydratase family protein [Bacteroidota bacterium]
MIAEENKLMSQKTFVPFTKIAVLGAGTMGSQIAAHLANAGARVLLLDIPASAKDEADKTQKISKNSIVDGAFKRMKSLKPDPLFTSSTASRIQTGNFDDDLSELANMDWVIEVVVERLDIKQSLLSRVERVIGSDTIVSTNTSGIPIAAIASGLSEDLKRRFLGTHFFNPPRYLPLMEVIPTQDTDPDVLERISAFARVFLGKGVVEAKDVPYFIGNRIGIFALLVSIEEGKRLGLTIAEVDTLTGPIVGRPRSGTYRTADVVGLDVMKSVIENLYAAIPDDESRKVFSTPPELDSLIEAGALGAKTRAGYYKKKDGVICSIDPTTNEYMPPSESTLSELPDIWSTGKLRDRLRALYASKSRSGDFFRSTLHRVLAYAARRIPEITEHPYRIDQAIRWGFAWELGPFQICDAIGYDVVCKGIEASGESMPTWFHDMTRAGHDGFYSPGQKPLEEGSAVSPPDVYSPRDVSYTLIRKQEDELGLASYTPGKAEKWLNENAQFRVSGDGVAVLEFRSKANTMGAGVLAAIQEAISLVEGDSDLRGLIIANEGNNFSVGANLAELATTLEAGQFDAVSDAVKTFQDTVQSVRYARKPVVVAVHQRVLGGATELVMSCPNPVAASESYLGLVELGVGLIPAGSGTMRLAKYAADRAPNLFPSEIQAVLAPLFEQVAMAKVSSSARNAQEMLYLSNHAPISMRADRRIYVAHQEVLRLSSHGYYPPVAGGDFMVGGKDTGAALNMMAYQYLQGGFMSEYDYELACAVSYVISGGSLNGPQKVTEQYILDLERETFMRLVGQKKTQDRITHLLQYNKPLRN